MRREHKHYTECGECKSKHISYVVLKCPNMDIVVTKLRVGQSPPLIHRIRRGLLK